MAGRDSGAPGVSGAAAAGSKRQKRQHYRRQQQRRSQKLLARDLQKLAATQLRELQRALKKAKAFELAKLARKLKAAAQEGKSTQELTARQAAVKVWWRYVSVVDG